MFGDRTVAGGATDDWGQRLRLVTTLARARCYYGIRMAKTFDACLTHGGADVSHPAPALYVIRNCPYNGPNGVPSAEVVVGPRNWIVSTLTAPGATIRGGVGTRQSDCGSYGEIPTLLPTPQIFHVGCGPQAFSRVTGAAPVFAYRAMTVKLYWMNGAEPLPVAEYTVLSVMKLNA